MIILTKRIFVQYNVVYRFAQCFSLFSLLTNSKLILQWSLRVFLAISLYHSFFSPYKKACITMKPERVYLSWALLFLSFYSRVEGFDFNGSKRLHWSIVTMICVYFLFLSLIIIFLLFLIIYLCTFDDIIMHTMLVLRFDNNMTVERSLSWDPIFHG